MFKEITIGQYYQTESPIHRLDPRVKLIATFAYIISLFVVHSWTGYLIAAVAVAIVIAASHVPFGYIMRGMKAVMMILMITVIFNLFLTEGRPLVHFWKLTITYEGVDFASKMAVRLIFLIIGSSLMTLTTTPNQLTDALEDVLGPLKKIHVPVHEISMMMSIALRFIPILMEETDKIMKAQMARGADFESKNLMKKIQSLVPLLVPLFISAFRRANDLAMAMEARCYHGGDNRTQMKPLRYESRDYISYVVMWAYLGIAIVFRIVGI